MNKRRSARAGAAVTLATPVGGALGAVVGMQMTLPAQDLATKVTIIGGLGGLGSVLAALVAAGWGFLGGKASATAHVSITTKSMKAAAKLLVVAQPANRYSQLVPTRQQRLDSLTCSVDWQRRKRPVSSLPKVFATVGNQMVILGAPGSGKTAAAYYISDVLLARAQRDATATVPVVVELTRWSTWRERNPKATLVDWLTDEISFTAQYQVSVELIRLLLNAGQITPIMDGLDEISNPADRTACLRALSGYLGGLAGSSEVPSKSFILCCRTEEYEAVEIAWRVPGEHHVIIEPVERTEAARYLARTGRANVAPVVDALRAGQPVLVDVLSVPLGLRILHDQEGPAVDRLVTELLGTRTVDEAWRFLWEAQLAAALTNLSPESSLQARRWMSWLAQGLQRRDSQVFWLHELYLYVDPSRLRRIQRSLGLRIGLFGPLPSVCLSASAMGILVGQVWESLLDRNPLLLARLGIPSIAQSHPGFAAGLIFGLWSYLTLAFLLGLVGGMAPGLATEYLDPRPRLYKWPTLRSMRSSLTAQWKLNIAAAMLVAVSSLTIGLLLGMLLWPRLNIAPGTIYGLIPTPSSGLSLGLYLGLFTSAPLVLLSLIFLTAVDAIEGHIQVGELDVDKADDASWALRQTRRVGLTAGLGLALLAGTSVALPSLMVLPAVIPSHGYAEVTAILLGLGIMSIVVVTGSLASGLYGVLLHRAALKDLSDSGSLPLNLMSFLDEAAAAPGELPVLHKIRGSYRFFHRELQQHLATPRD